MHYEISFTRELRVNSKIPVLDWIGPAWGSLGDGTGWRVLRAKSLDKLYSMHWYPFMNNSACQICCIQYQIYLCE